MRIRLPKTRRYRLYLYVLSTLIILTAIDLLIARLLRHITLAPDTTHITTPLLPNGTPDYLAAINARLSAGVTPENNAAIPLIALLGPRFLPNNSAAVAEGLHIPPPVEPVHPFVVFERWYEQHHPDAHDQSPDIDNPATSIIYHPWQPADHPDAAAWLNAFNADIDAFQQLTRRPRYFIPLTTASPDHLLIETQLPNLGAIRGLVNAALIRANRRIAAHDLDGAWQDLLAAHRMARLLSNGSATLLEQLVAAALETSAAIDDITLAQSPDLTPDQARRCIADLRALQPLSPVARTLDTAERYSLLSFTCTAATRGTPWAIRSIYTVINAGNLGPPEPPTNWFYAFLPVNYNHALRSINGFYDQLTAAAAAPKFSDSVALQSALDTRIQSLAQRNFISRFTTGDVFSIWLFPFINLALARERAALQRTDLAQLAFALAAYHADHHAYPDSLDPLLFAYLPALPKDRFADAPLHYHATADTYLVYSIGPNLKDDAGRDRTTSKQTPPPDDIAISLPPLAPPAASQPATVR
ncbi:MAG TPA: hypothetical protein VHQ47_07665 [Phycisphaerae bacterium]|nr:hypothetical protein [Phycisphaerae bacterium]